MDKLSYDIKQLEPDRLCIEITISGQSLGLVYYERAKRGFNKKPISMDRWVCVDAKVEGLYTYGSMEIEYMSPKMIMDECQLLLKSGGY